MPRHIESRSTALGLIGKNTYETYLASVMLLSSGLYGAGVAMCRACLESVVNICFIVAKGKAYEQRAIDHLVQKAARDMKRDMEYGGFRAVLFHSVVDNPDWPGNLGEKIDLFTGAKDQELRSWTPENLKKRIDSASELLGGNSPAVFTFAVMAIYRQGSEVLHGTAYGGAVGMGLESAPILGGSKERSQSEKLQQTAFLYAVLASVVGLSVKAIKKLGDWAEPYDERMSEIDLRYTTLIKEALAGEGN